MRFLNAIISALLPIVCFPAAAEWQIVEDDFLYMRKDVSGGSVRVYCSKVQNEFLACLESWDP